MNRLGTGCDEVPISSLRGVGKGKRSFYMIRNLRANAYSYMERLPRSWRRCGSQHQYVFTSEGLVALAVPCMCPSTSSTHRAVTDIVQYRSQRREAMKVMLWIIAIIFIIGLLVVTGVLGLIF
jgi:hypothetical protein